MELLLLVLLVLVLVGAFGGVGYRSGWWGGERVDGGARTPFFGFGANALGVIVLVLLVILVVSLLS